MLKMFTRLSLFFIATGLFVLIASGYAVAFTDIYGGRNLQKSKLYQPVFLEGLFGKRKIKRQKTLAEEVADLKIKDKETFQKYTKEIHKIPFNDPKLSFKMRMPDSWEELPLTLEKELELSAVLPSTLVHYIGPPISELRPHLKVQAMKLTREITAKNWLRYFILINGYSILDNKIEAVNDRMAAVQFVYVKEDITYSGFLKAIIHGDIVTIARIDVPQKFERIYAVLQSEAVNSFSLVFPQSGTIEARKKQKLGNGALYFSYPASWVKKNQKHNEAGEKVVIELHNVADETTVFGFIKFKVVKRENGMSLADELAKIRQELKERFGLYIKSIEYSKPSYGPIRFDYIREEKYIAGFKKSFNTQEQELRFVVMADVEWYIFIYMLSPLEKNDLLNWAINDRAYRIIRDSFE